MNIIMKDQSNLLWFEAALHSGNYGQLHVNFSMQTCSQWRGLHADV